MVRCYAEEDGVSLSVLCLICSLWYLHIVYTLTTPEPATSKEAQLLNERRANSWVGPGNFACKKKRRNWGKVQAVSLLNVDDDQIIAYWQLQLLVWPHGGDCQAYMDPTIDFAKGATLCAHYPDARVDIGQFPMTEKWCMNVQIHVTIFKTIFWGHLLSMHVWKAKTYTHIIYTHARHFTHGDFSPFFHILHVPALYNNNNNNVHLSCAHQRPERSHDTY